MITVTISINTSPIITRSARRIETTTDGKVGIYKSDDGSIVKHRISDGAAILATKLLEKVETI